MEKFALIVAGGCGSRMNTGIPKQFLDLAGKPVLMRTMERFARYDPDMKIVLVLPPDYIGYWESLCQKYLFKLSHITVGGGQSRFASVKNGLEHLPQQGLVFIHDGVRPLVSLKTINNCETTALEKGNALPVIPVTDSLRLIDKLFLTDSSSQNISKPVDRRQFVLVQTPQTFRIDQIRKAYFETDDESFTDDASVYEALGEHINLVDGNPENIKITCPSDLQIAEFLFLKDK